VRSAAFAPAPPAEHRPVLSKRCGVCARTHDLDGWNALPAVATLPAASVRPHLSIPFEGVIDLRTCPCGAVLAARRR
jgi:hypothetical protein